MGRPLHLKKRTKKRELIYYILIECYECYGISILLHVYSFTFPSTNSYQLYLSCVFPFRDLMFGNVWMPHCFYTLDKNRMMDCLFAFWKIKWLLSEIVDWQRLGRGSLSILSLVLSWPLYMCVCDEAGDSLAKANTCGYTSHLDFS